MKKMIAAAMATLMLLMAGCSGGGDGGAASSGSASSGGSQSNYPNGPVQIVLPAKPGGDVDSSGRLFAKDLEKYLGTTVVPVNVDGGGGNLAMKQIMDGDADGQQVINYFSYANAATSGLMKICA